MAPIAPPPQRPLHPNAYDAQNDDHFRDQCGVFGIYNHEEAANLTYLGLYALQHRGQESAGIVSSDEKRLFSHRGMGLVADVFPEDMLKNLKGTSAIGHVRYSTEGASVIENAQPFSFDFSEGSLAIAHNGNLTNAEDLYRQLLRQGALFQSTSDTENIIHLIARSQESGVINRIIDALLQVKGAFSLVLLTPQYLIGVRDPHGFRPLVLGKLNRSLILSSETCSLDLIEAEFMREIEPGEMVVIDKNGLTSHFPFAKTDAKPCVFEHIYFARPDSKVFGSSVYETRKELGRQLSRECPVDADIVVPVPDSGVPAGLGYAEQSKIPFALGIIRNHYVGRTFIEPQQSIRHFGVKIKLNAVKEVIQGKRVVLVDDSLVRGTTARKIVKMIRDAGAKEVHMRISAPPTTHSCFYGIDTPHKKELIASNHSLEEIRAFLTADSLGYLSLPGVYQSCGKKEKSFCDACFSGDYAVPVQEDGERVQRILPFVRKS